MMRNVKKLDKDIAQFSSQQDKKINKLAWELITKQGIWKIPVPKKNGGEGLGWDEFVASAEGVTNTYKNFDFISSFITQASALYLLLQYGTEENKKRYLPFLIQGEIACISISKSNIKLKIDDQHIFFSSDVNQKALCDHINFERILYGIFSTNLALPLIGRLKEVVNKTDSSSVESFLNEISGSIETNIKNCRDTLRKHI